jgi:hypothetical protein
MQTIFGQNVGAYSEDQWEALDFGIIWGLGSLLVLQEI